MEPKPKDAPTPEAERSHTWRRRWKGSPPQKGFSIVAEDHLTHPTEIAFLGEVDGDAVDALINAHNAALSVPAAQDGVMVPDGSMSVDEAIAAVADLFPGADKQALRVLARALTKKPTPNAIRGDNSLVTPCEFCGGRGFTDDGHVEWDGQIVSAPEGCVECDGRGTVAIRGDKGAEAVAARLQAQVDALIALSELQISAEDRKARLAAIIAAPTQAAAKDTP